MNYHDIELKNHKSFKSVHYKSELDNHWPANRQLHAFAGKVVCDLAKRDYENSQNAFWSYLVSSWPWPLICWSQNLISLSLSSIVYT